MNFLLLRGLVREQRHWAEFPDLLKKGIPGTEVYFLDLPGIGSEVERPSPTSLEGIVEDLRLRFKSLNAKAGPWTVVSISLGTMIALRWCELHPEDFNYLVGMNSSAANLNPPWQRLRPPILPKLSLSARLSDPVARERAILELTTNLRSDLDSIAQEWGAISLKSFQLRVLALRQLAGAIVFRSPAELAAPSLILVSKKDRFTDYRCSLNLAQKLNSSLDVHPNAGHDLPLDDGPWVVDRIRLWLERQASS